MRAELPERVREGLALDDHRLDIGAHRVGIAQAAAPTRAVTRLTLFGGRTRFIMPIMSGAAMPQASRIPAMLNALDIVRTTMRFGYLAISGTADQPMYSAYASSTTTMQGALAINRSMSAGSVALPVGLFGLQCQMIFAPLRGGEDRVDIRREVRLERHALHRRAHLLGDDRVHRVGRHRDDHAVAVIEEGLGGDIEDFVRARADNEVVRADAVVGAEEVRQFRVGGVEILVRLPLLARRLHRRIPRCGREGRRIEVEADDIPHAHPMQRRDRLAGEFPCIGVDIAD